MLAGFVLLTVLNGMTAAAEPQDKPPSKSQITKWVDRYFKTDDPGERAEILSQLEKVPPLSPKELADWREKRLPKLAKKAGPKLQTSGDNYWYDKKAKRGRYIVRGKGKKGLMIGLHGGGAGSGDAGSSASSFGGPAGNQGWVAIFPEVLEKTEHGWTDSGTEEFILELIEAGLRTFKIDPDQVYLAGHSMGGYGTWTLGAHHADRFAGLAAYAGAPTPYWDDNEQVIGIQDGVLPNLRNVPFHIYQSLDDPRVPPAVNIFGAKALGEQKEKYGGYNFIYQEVDGRGHGFPPGGPDPALEWISQYKRESRPPKVLWEPVLSWKKQFYWLRWETPEKGAIIEAEVKGNTVEVKTSDACPGLKVMMDDRLFESLDQEITVRLNGNFRWSGMVQPSLAILVRQAAESADPARWYFAEASLDPAE